MLHALVEKASPGLCSALRRRPSLHAETVAVFADAGHPLRRRARLLAVRPLVSHGVSGLTTDRDRLRRAADTGTAASTPRSRPAEARPIFVTCVDSRGRSRRTLRSR